ncbi:MAG: NUDIX hydrolase [Pseudomonadota bacterium]|nr:NUDIX hydrolase [Pseudomonadota bacterium]
MKESIETALTIPSSTVLLIRDDIDQLEVFMVTRNSGIDFAGGALVYPGGKVDPGDLMPGLEEYCEGVEGLSDSEVASRVCGIRELFEEAGFLLAREENQTQLVDGARCKDLDRLYRESLLAGNISMRRLVEKEGLVLACDCMVPFAHWITPPGFPKRFDTWFYLARAPNGQEGSHDNSESINSTWISPDKALAGARNGLYTIVFATRMNLLKLGRSAKVEIALRRAKNDKIVTVEPKIERTEAGVSFSIPLEAGYGIGTELETNGSTQVPAN